MPTRAPHPCPRCGTLLRYGQDCPRHPRQRAVDTRPNAGQRGYGAKWQEYSVAYRKAHPLCECGCGSPSEMVDHIVPVHGQDDPLFWDPSNHQALSDACHNRKSAADGSRGRGRGKFVHAKR